MLDQTRLIIKDDLEIVDGELRMSLSSDLGRNLVTSWLDEFMGSYPNLTMHPHELPSHNGLFYQLNDIIHDTWKFSRNKTG